MRIFDGFFRIISNRASAQKSRLKKLQYIAEMERKAKALEVTIGSSHRNHTIQRYFPQHIYELTQLQNTLYLLLNLSMKKIS